MDLAAGRDTWVELYLSERALVARHILLQQGHQRLGLLRAQVNPLEVVQFDLRFGLLLQRPKDKEEVPHVHPNLHAIGIVLAVIRAINQLDIRLRWICHT